MCNGDAGWGDPGFFDRWTMEIGNNNEREHVPLPVGMPIAQIAFYHTGKVEGDYTTLSGNYQTSADLDDLVANWQPSHMLPKAHRKSVSLPQEINGLSDNLK